MKALRGAFKENSGYKILFLTIALTALGYGIFKGMIDNYLAEIVSMNEFDRGLAEFFRELPGLLLIFILAVLYTFSAEKLYKIGAVIMLIGMAMLSVTSPTKVLVTLAICIHSLGEHIQLGMRSTIVLNYAKTEKEGRALGYSSSVQQIGTLLGFTVVILAFRIFAQDQPFKLFFLIATLFTGLSMLASFGMKSSSQPDRSGSRFYFRKKFTKFYMLEVFYGARKQVFLTFGPYVLILFYNADTAMISILYAVSAVCCFLLAPVVGRIIDRLGYKIVMIMDTVILVAVCFFYGFAHHFFPMRTAFIICCVNYVLDSIISMASMASSVYVNDISDSPEEVKATLATGISVNHLITILIALFGGWIWRELGMETLFIVSAVLGLFNSAYAATIKVKKKEAARPGE